MSYYKNFDTIGLISLNDWYVIDFPLKNYDENGNEIESAASTSFLIIPGLSEPPVRTLRATIPENGSHIFR